jgi:acetyl-CoA C-acetyltransferase
MGVWDNSPVIIGVGEASERIDSSNWAELSPADLAALAAGAALKDAGARQDLTRKIDVVAAIRQFEVSAPRAVAPFGRADNFPRAVARRLGADPRRAILEPVGGQGPQHLVNEFAREIASGAARMVLLCGAEAISTVRRLASMGETRHWSEMVGGALEDRGYGDPLLSPELPRHGARTPITVYALFENARRARLGLNRSDYALEMARLFAPFTEVAAANPHAMSREVYSAENLATVTPANRLVADPYTRRLVARDQANQGAAVLMTSAGEARALGVPEDRFVYLHGGADVRERLPLDRADLSQSPAAVLAAKRALERAGTGADCVDFFDLYSCFPIAVFNLRDGLGLTAQDHRPLTVTGGLPYFGGAGNNYSMHALASMVRRLRETPDAMGLVAANGGFLSKCSVGVYSAKPAPAPAFDDAPLQAEVQGWTAPPLSAGQEAGVVETYTIDFSCPSPAGVIIGRDGEGAREVAASDPAQPELVQAIIEADPLGAKVRTSMSAEGRTLIVGFEPTA